MTDTARRLPAHVPRLTPEEIANRGFASAFRGISEPDVRSFLRRVADEVAALAERERELAAEVGELRERLRHPAPLSEQELLDALGEETARVLRSAQAAADDIRKRAEARAAELLRDAEQRARAAREEAEQRAKAIREEAETRARMLEEQARAAADARRAEAEGEAEQRREQAAAAAQAEIEAAREQGRAMVAEARAVRERVLADLGRRRSLLQLQVDELRAGRDRLLDAYRVVKRTLEEATGALAEVEARAAAERAAAAASGAAPTGPAPVAATAEEAAAAPRPAGTPAGSAPGPSGAPAEGAPEVVAPEAAVPEGVVAERHGPEAPGPEAPGPDVEALFARLRAASAEPEPIEEPSEPSGATDAEVGPAGREAPAAAEPPAGEAPAAAEPPPGGPPPAVAPPAGAGDRGTGVSPAAGDGAALTRRAEVLGPLHRELERKAKRLLGDDQNEVLDRLRQRKRAAGIDELLPEAAAQRARFVEVLGAPLVAAYRAGATFVGGSPDVKVPAELGADLAARILEPLRRAVGEVLAESEADREELRGRIGARYREHKGRSLGDALGDALAEAWARGTFDATGPGTRLRWVPERAGRCPDCDDNALEVVTRGEAFPTGVAHPPAHPGCRCFLVVEAAT